MHPHLDHPEQHPESSRWYQIGLLACMLAFGGLMLADRGPAIEPAGTLELPGLGRFELNPVYCQAELGDRLVLDVRVRREGPVAIECRRLPLLEQMPARRRS